MNNPTENGIVIDSIRKLVSAIGTQALILGLSFVTGLVMPERMGPEMYGYWQIYALYLSYLNLFGIGYSDGASLYYGGTPYNNLPFYRIRGATGLLFAFILTSSACLFLITYRISNEELQYIYQMLALNIPCACVSAMTLSVSAAVNKTAQYNGLNLLLRLLTIFSYIIMMAAMITDFRSVILADTIARFLFMIICLCMIQKLVFGARVKLPAAFSELREKSSAGMNITLAAIAAGTMPVAGKFVIQFEAPTNIYGEYSFAVSLLHIVTAFTGAAGLIIFPLLKKFHVQDIMKYYPMLSFICSTSIFAALFMYIPAKLIIIHFMPEYQPVLTYLHMLLVICVPLGRVQVLILPYYKALRFEQYYFVANIVGMFSLIGLTWASYYLSKSIYSVAAVSTVAYFVWSLFLEQHLIKNIVLCKDFVKAKLADIFMMTAFIFAGSMDKCLSFLIIYMLAYIVYTIVHTHYFKQMAELLKIT